VNARDAVINLVSSFLLDPEFFIRLYILQSKRIS
jgi:hypothetical protein